MIAAASPHRAEAFQACRYVIERVKQIAPIWKREVFEGGEEWVEGATADPSRRGGAEGRLRTRMRITIRLFAGCGICRRAAAGPRRAGRRDRRAGLAGAGRRSSRRSAPLPGRALRGGQRRVREVLDTGRRRRRGGVSAAGIGGLDAVRRRQKPGARTVVRRMRSRRQRHGTAAPGECSSSGF